MKFRPPMKEPLPSPPLPALPRKSPTKPLPANCSTLPAKPSRITKPPIPGPLRRLARAYAAAGDKDTAKTLLGQARTIADGIDPQGEDRPEALASVSLAQRATGDNAVAADTLQAAMVALDKMTNSGNRCHALWTIAGDQANAGDSAGHGKPLPLH